MFGAESMRPVVGSTTPGEPTTASSTPPFRRIEPDRALVGGIAVEIGEHPAEVARADVDAEHEHRVGDEVVERRARPAPSGRPAELADEARLLEGAERGADGGLRQSGAEREVRAGRRAAVLQRREDGAEVVLADCGAGDRLHPQDNREAP
jgi:hypothetical protein